MLDERYLLKLHEYLHKKTNYSLEDMRIVIYADAEIQYILNEFDTYYQLSMIERGAETVVGVFNSKDEMQRKFAIWMKGLFGNGIDYPYIERFDNIKEINILKDLMNHYTNSNFFSLNEIVEDKIVLTYANSMYEIFFVDRNKRKYSIEQSIKAPFIFKRFYTEVVFYQEMLKRLNEYELIFNDKLDYDCKINILDFK